MISINEILKKNSDNNKKITREKGTSLVKFLDNFVVIDIETTGFSPRYNSIIEISALKIRNNKVISSYNTLIKDTSSDFKLPDNIVNLTGIDSTSLEDGISIDTAIDEFSDFIGTDVIIGHNVNFDINFLYDAMLKSCNSKLNNDFIDTLKLSKRLIKDLKHHGLWDLIEHFNIDVSTHHRALADCYSTLKIFYELKKIYLIDPAQLDLKVNIHKSYPLAANSKNISTTNTNFNEENAVFSQNVVFTGKLVNFVRKDAM